MRLKKREEILWERKGTILRKGKEMVLIKKEGRNPLSEGKARQGAKVLTGKGGNQASVKSR